MALKLVQACWLACAMCLVSGVKPQIETQIDANGATVSLKDGVKHGVNLSLRLSIRSLNNRRKAAWAEKGTSSSPVAEYFSPIEGHPSWKILDAPCGESLSDKIIGGKNAGLGQYPWIARLGRFKYIKGLYKRKVDWYCAGSVISRLYVLTAAHCIQNPDLKVIRLGEYDTNSALDCDATVCAEPLQDIAPLHIISHPDYMDITAITPNDIALIRLEKEIYFNDWVSPVCLPRSNSANLYKGMAEAIGWGLTIPLVVSYSAVLQRISLPIVSTKQCMTEVYKTLHEGTFCAGGKIEKDTCNGDSGGPLLKVDDMDGTPKYYVIGIVSFGPSDCGNGEVAGYTNVSYHLRWILDNLNPS